MFSRQRDLSRVMQRLPWRSRCREVPRSRRRFSSHAIVERSAKSFAPTPVRPDKSSATRAQVGSAVFRSREFLSLYETMSGRSTSIHCSGSGVQLHPVTDVHPVPPRDSRRGLRLRPPEWRARETDRKDMCRAGLRLHFSCLLPVRAASSRSLESVRPGKTGNLGVKDPERARRVV